MDNINKGVIGADRIAGFDFSSIEKILRANFGYGGRIDDLKIDDEEIVVRLHSNDFDVSIMKPEYFKLRPIVFQDYIGNGDGRRIIEITDWNRKLSIIGYKAEDKDDIR